ncbi:uncharacterized protein RSE6_03905 [Rhynchosporium secalis]|uniref:Heterokaryon incompatibility domain-containing protein n=1 Tax=Rhynchosporium secalis TaxID=38038 RepID=A0A1E1M3Z7_RHYSE|nr:uncharacterized protein RSE6_03905 [Rhynchosporium secalis]
MSEDSYTYKPLAEPASNIRLVSLFPGNGDAPIKIEFSQISLGESSSSCRDGQSLKAARDSLPKDWGAYESLEGRIIYVHKNAARTVSTSWQHPNVQFFQSFEEKKVDIKAGGNEVVYEAVSHIREVEDNPNRDLFELNPENSKENTELLLVVDPTNPLRCEKLFLSRNVAGLLRFLRQKDTKRVLWLDAVCINQADIAEKSAQMSRMRGIFSMASRVIVFIGPPTEDSKLAMETLNYLGKQAGSTTERRRLPAPDTVEKTWFESSVQLPYDDSTWEVIGKLLKRPWFECLWGIQEAHLARKCMLLCGDEQLDWITFRYAILTLWYNKAASWGLPSVMRLIGNLVEFLPNHPISDILYQVHGRSCTDSRDRVYGIHGLFPLNFQELIQPDYTLSVDEVYKNTTVAHIGYSKRLEILRLCHTESWENSDTPSWVPNLSSKLKIARRMDWQFAAGHSRSEVSFEGPRTIIATGILCATVVKVHQPLHTGASLKECLQLVRGWEPENLESAKYVAGGSIREAHARTLTGNALKDRFPERDYAGSWDEWIAQDSPTALFGAKAKTPLSADSQPTPLEKLALSLVPGRAYVTTSEGYFGLAPIVARAGDIIAVFLGCESPILLRPQPNNKFRILGECLIFGLHDGNAFLGSLPSPWKAHVFNDSTGLFTILRFHNTETKITQDEDPRLDPLPEAWEAVDRGERTSEDPRIYRCFKHKQTGEIVNSDPRMEPDTLRARGVNLKSFALV